MRARITHHAEQRARQRHGWTGTETDHWLDEVIRHGILIPRRLEARVDHRPHLPTEDRRGVRIRVLGSVVAVVRGRLVITTWRLTDEQLAGLLVWTALKVWP